MRNIIVCICLLLSSTIGAQAIDYQKISALPVQQGGRIKPLHSIALSSLLLIQEKQTIRYNEKTISADQWITEIISGQTQPDLYPIFLIHHPDIITLIDGKTSQKRYSFKDLFNSILKISEQTQKFSHLKAAELTAYQSELRQLSRKINLYLQLKASTVIYENESTLTRYLYLSRAFTEKELSEQEKLWFKQVFSQLAYQNDQVYFSLFPPFNHHDTETPHWLSMPTVLLLMVNPDVSDHPLTQPYHTLLLSIRNKDSKAFDEAYQNITSYLKTNHHNAFVKAKQEHWFNMLQPFYRSASLYFIGLLLLIGASLKQLTKQNKGIFLLTWSQWTIKTAFILHTLGLLARMMIQGRPPVTNLYSSSVFVGWFAIALCLILYRSFKNNALFGTASIIGTITLIIAHHLSFSGDTLEMMQAVLDSNFWLSTHVITITMGYSAVFLAGALGIYFLIARLTPKGLTPENESSLYKLAYTTVCIGLVLSFIGTVLGGIWADQSWGRFWGWDPKENGALLIVLWTAICLHARLAGWIQAKGFMQYCVFGNMITSFSWFGVNMLGVGLHSYGFMDSALVWLVLFNISQGLIIILGWLPAKNKLQ